jgi:hypothetical protein
MLDWDSSLETVFVGTFLKSYKDYGTTIFCYLILSVGFKTAQFEIPAENQGSSLLKRLFSCGESTKSTIRWTQVSNSFFFMREDDDDDDDSS